MNEDTRGSVQGALCCGLLVLLAVLFLGLSGCDQIEGAGGNPAVAAEVGVAAARIKRQHDNQPALPDDLGNAKEAPEQTTPADNRVVVYVYSPPPAPHPQHFKCSVCERMKADADILPVKCVFRDPPEWVIQWINEDSNNRGYPVIHYYSQGNWRRTCGYEGPAKFAAWCGKPLLPKSIAPEVATQRPFADPWRQELLRKHGRQAVSAHTNLDAETVALPTTQINLRSQCVEFSGPSRESRLNRWFSVSFGAGTVSHSGSTVEFSNPPELRFHLFEGGRGEVLDSLKAIEFTAEGAAFHMTRFGTIHFRVK